MINSGAGDRQTAIRWLVDAEGLLEEHDAGYICYCIGISYDYQKEILTAISIVH